MTRKKSNVKALALAVTCAILAGGYSGLNPVYAAADTLYKDGTNVTTSNTPSGGYGSNEAIEQLTVGSVTIGGTGGNAGQIIAKNIVGITNVGDTTPSAISINGATFANGGAITATSLSLNGTDVKNAIEAKGAKTDVETNKTNIDKLNQTVGDDTKGLVKKVADNANAIQANATDIANKADKTDLNTANDEINALKEKTTNFNTDGTTLTSMDEVGATKVSATTLEVGGKVINGEKVDGYDAAVSKTTKIIQNTDGSTTVNDVTFNAGAVSGVKSINDKIKISDDGTVTINENAAKNPVTINSKGIKVGNNSAVVSEDGFKTSGDLYVGTKTHPTEDATDARFYVKGADGSIKAADGKFTVDDKGNVVSQGSVTAKGDLSAANGNFTVNGANGDTTVKGKLDVTGDITGQNITAKGALNGDSLNVTKNATVGGTLDVTGDITGQNITANGVLKGASLNVTGNATVDGTLNSKGNFSVGDSNQFTVDAATGNVVSKGKITSENAKIGAVEIANDGTITGVKAITTDTLTVNYGFNTNGNIESMGLKVNGNAEISGTLGVNGAVKGASFNGATITATTFNGATIDATHFNNVTLSGGNVDATAITGTTITGTTVTDGAGASMNAGTVTGTKITDGTGFIATGGNVTAKDINATTATIAGVGFAANNVSGINNLTATGTIQGATLKVNDSNLLDSNGLTATKAVIDNLTIDGASITSNNADGSVGVAGITVDKTGAITGVKAIDGVVVAGNTASGLTIGSGATAVTIGGNSLALSSTGFNVDDDGDVTGKSFKVNGSNYLDSTGLTTEKAVIGGVNTLNDKGIDTSKNLHVGGEATFGNSTGIHTTINGGTITSTDGTDSTTIGPNKIKTKTLDVEDIILRNEMKDGNGATINTINIKGSDGSMSVASGAFAVDKDGQLTNKITGTAGGFGYETKLETSKSGIKANYTINGNQNTIDMGASGISIGVVSGTTPSVGAGFKAELDKATMGYGTANSIVVSAETITSALGTDVTRVMTNSATEQSIVDKVGAASRSLKAGEIVDAAGGMTITTNNTGTTFSNGTNTTLINGSAITSTKATGDTGVLDGSNLTLKKGANETVLDAGKVTFKSTNVSQHGGTETTIDGGVITTDTLNVQRINLGKEMVNGDGTTTTVSNLSIDEYGNIKAAGGKFTVAGTNNTEGNVGAITNTVGGTNFRTDKTGAGMSFNNNPANPSSGITSNVSVGNNNANVSAGAGSIDVTNESITSKVGTDASSTIKADNIVDKVGDYSVTTNDKGTTFAKKGDVKTTNINGGTITTGKLITDELVIKGNRSGDTSGDGGESGSIAFGGDGTITSNIKDGAKETTFKTTADGVSSEVTNGTYTSNVDQSADRIGSVITGGNVKIGSVADASLGVLQNGAGTVNASGDTVTEASQAFSKDGSITSVAKDKDGKSSTLVQNGTGLEYTDSAKADNATRINSSDVSIGSATDDSKRINLSDLGQIDDLDSEIQSRKEYQDNKTAVGAINAEAGIRREEVARLDNRIDDVNNRVDKVGAMAAAIASLKSIGYDPQTPSEFSIGLGQYKGETGVAMGFFHYPNKNFMINVSLSTAGGETMGGIGATWRFGHKSPQKLLEEQREAQARKELAAAEKYQAAAKLAKEAQERAEYAAKLARQAQVSADNAKAAADATQAKHFQ
ncbi:YadA-like family protein [Phascolarctobacterium sp.]